MLDECDDLIVAPMKLFPPSMQSRNGLLPPSNLELPSVRQR